MREKEKECFLAVFICAFCAFLMVEDDELVSETLTIVTK